MRIACVVAIKEGASPKELLAVLEGEGYEISLLEVDKETFEKLRKSSPDEFPAEFRELLENADLLIFYLTDLICDAEDFGGFAGIALGGGAEILGVWPSGCNATAAPKTIADLGASLVSEDSSNLAQAISGQEDVWELPDGEPAKKTDKNYQKKC